MTNITKERIDLLNRNYPLTHSIVYKSNERRYYVWTTCDSCGLTYKIKFSVFFKMYTLPLCGRCQRRRVKR